MMSEGDRYPVLKRKLPALRTSLVLAAAFCALSLSQAAAAPAADSVGTLQVTPQVRRLMDEMDKALKAGNVNLAMIQLKNAVRLAPDNGEVRARLGVMLLLTGAVVAAERELRQAMNDLAPPETVVPGLLQAMLQRNEIKELLTEFPDPPQGTQDNTAADILKARALALQRSGRPAESKAAIERSLSLRHDTTSLVEGAELARERGDFALARSLSDEAMKLSPTNEQAWVINVTLTRQTGGAQKALASAEDFVRSVPQSVIAKVLQIEVLLELQNDTRAKQEVDALAKQAPKSPYVGYYRAVLLAHAKDYRGAWRILQGLQPEFIQSEPRIALMVSSVAAASGNLESGGAILTTLVSRNPGSREARLQLAAVRLGQRSPRGAIDVLTPLKSSNDPTVHALLAQAYLQLRQFNDAIASLEIANASPNANDLLKRQLALSQLQVGDTDQAIEGLRELVKRSPGNGTVALPLIAALTQASKWDEALALLDNLAKDSPNSPFAPFNRGQILVARGNFSEAQAAFDKALTLDPKFQPALFYRGNVLLARGDSEAAKKDFDRLLTQNPTNMMAYIRLAQIALDSGQEPEALAQLARAIKAAPNDPTPRLALANYQVARAKYQEAQATLAGLLQVSRDNPEGLALQGSMQILQGATADAVKTFRALATSNASPAAYDLLARALFLEKDQSGAEDNAKRAIELAPNSTDLRLTLVDIQIGGHKEADALATARAFAGTNPGPVGDMLLAETFLRLKRMNEAEALLDKSLSSKPDARMALRLSQIALAAGNSKKGTTVLANWVAKNPNDFGMRREYASYQMSAGDLAGARKEYEFLLKQHPEDPVVLNNLGWLVQKDDPNRALSMVSLANKIAPRSAEIADTFGWLKYLRHDNDGALPLLQRAHDIDAKNAPISYHLAVALDANGKRVEAKSLLQATLAKTPKFDGSEDARKLLARW